VVDLVLSSFAVFIVVAIAWWQGMREWPEALVPIPKLDIPGSAHVPPNEARFLRSFGIDPDHLHDIRAVRGPDLNAETRRLLQEVMAHSHVRGLDAAAIANGTRQLSEHEALYFVLTRQLDRYPRFAVVERVR